MSKNYLIFDIDGVLIRTLDSYPVAIQKTAEWFLKRPVSLQEVRVLKALHGTNNDWFASYVLVNAELLGMKTGSDLPDFLGKEQISFEAIKDVFQEIYLGTKRYQASVNLPRQDGVWKTECLMFSEEELRKLKAQFDFMGILTGRTEDEANFILEHFQIRDLFDQLVSVESFDEEWLNTNPGYREFGLDKSNPAFLNEFSGIQQGTRIWYLGDHVSDMALVSNARKSLPLKGIHFLVMYPETEQKALIQEAKIYAPDVIALTKEQALNGLSLA